MIIPLLLSIFATLTAAVMSYGVHPGWARFEWGIGLIMLTRRLQWPLIATSIILCLVLIGFVIGGRRRAWWLIALGPVMVLFVHRFLTAPVNRLSVVDEPEMVAAEQADQLKDDDYVVGVVFNQQAYAYPYSALAVNPVIVQTDRDKRLVLFWSARANAAVAMVVKLDLKARHLDIVSDPEDSILIYNMRSGQFIVALTGTTRDGQLPAGFERELPVEKVTWKQWRQGNGESRVLLPGRGQRGPIKMDPSARIILVGVGSPLAIRSDDVSATPLNTMAGETPVVVFRDESGQVRVFDRRIERDLIPRFTARRDPEKKSVFMTDADTGTRWSALGVAVDGDKKYRGHKLSPIPVQEDVYWNAVRFWNPRARLLTK